MNKVNVLFEYVGNHSFYRGGLFRIMFLNLLLITIILLMGGITMANAQEKPPLLSTPSSPIQTPPQPLGTVPPPPPPGKVPPAPPAGAIPPPPAAPPGVMSPTPSSNIENIQANAATAVTTATKTKAYLTPGKVWIMTGPRGEIEIKAAVTYDGMVVSILHFNPSDGSLLPSGLPPVEYGVAPQIENTKRNLSLIVSSLVVLNGAEYREPENAWIVPLAYKNMIVAHLKVYADGIHIIPDYPANQEMQAYGR